MKNFYVFNAGCIRRGLDCIRIKKYLELNGWKMANSPSAADLLIISTCGVVKMNQENSLKAVEHAVSKKRDNAECVIIGCLPDIDPDSLNRLGKFKFVSSRNIERMDEIINPDIPMSAVRHPDSVKSGGPIIDYLIARSFCRKSKVFKKLFSRYAMNNSFLKYSVKYWRIKSWINDKFKLGGTGKIEPYYNIKIADGCLSKCSYCSTRFATGTLKSRPLKEVMEDFNNGHRQGYKVIQLISEDTGSYGLDIGSSITELLSNIFNIDGDFKLVIIDFNPWWLICQQEKLIPLLSKNQHRIKEIFMPFQSGSDKILARMNREYKSGELLAALKKLKEAAPAIPVRTCVIIGFPGETEDDFTATQKLIREIPFAEVTVNRYEDRPLAGSAQLPDKISSEEIEARAKYLVEHLNCKLLS